MRPVLRRWLFHHWSFFACSFGTGLYWLVFFALPPQMRTWAIEVAAASLGCSVTGVLMKAHPRQEWAYGLPAKGRPKR